MLDFGDFSLPDWTDVFDTSQMVGPDLFYDTVTDSYVTAADIAAMGEDLSSVADVAPTVPDSGPEPAAPPTVSTSDQIRSIQGELGGNPPDGTLFRQYADPFTGLTAEPPDSSSWWSKLANLGNLGKFLSGIGSEAKQLGGLSKASQMPLPSMPPVPSSLGGLPSYGSIGSSAPAQSVEMAAVGGGGGVAPGDVGGSGMAGGGYAPQSAPGMAAANMLTAPQVTPMQTPSGQGVDFPAIASQPTLALRPFEPVVVPFGQSQIPLIQPTPRMSGLARLMQEG